MSHPRVAVVILNYNGANFLKQFLPSVLEHSGSAEVYVADNLSTDDSLHVLKENFPTVKVIRNKSNNGYAGGYNEALQFVRADYYALVNSDVEVTKDWLMPLIELFESNGNIAACQPKLLNFNKRNFFEYAGGSGGFMDKYGYPFCRGRIFDTDEEDKGQYNDTREIFWATGACFLVKASAFHEVGGFDASFFAHMEEIDLCWRLKNKGYSIYAMPKSVVYHVGGGTLQKTNPRKTFLNFRNNLCTITKNNTSAFWWLIILYRLLLDGAAGLKFLAGGQASLFFQVIKAHFAYYARIPGLLKQRSKLNKTRKSNLTGVYKGSLVFSYYLRRRKYFNDLTSILFT